MSRFRSPWLALFGGATLIALSLSSALGAKPDPATNRGQQVSTFVHSLQTDAEESSPEEPSPEESPAEEPAADGESSPSDHGQCVALVAQDETAVGPPNDNHGGAVSEAARVTCWPDTSGDQPPTEKPTKDSGDSEVESDGADTSTSGPTHVNNGHGRGHGGDSSED